MFKDGLFLVFEKYIEDRSLDLSHQLCPCNLVLFDIAKRCSSISLNKCRLRSSTSWPAAPPSDSYFSCPTVPRMSLSRRMSSSAPKGHQSWSHFDFVSFSLIRNSFPRFNRHSRRVNTRIAYTHTRIVFQCMHLSLLFYRKAVMVLVLFCAFSRVPIFITGYVDVDFV